MIDKSRPWISLDVTLSVIGVAAISALGEPGADALCVLVKETNQRFHLKEEDHSTIGRKNYHALVGALDSNVDSPCYKLALSNAAVYASEGGMSAESAALFDRIKSEGIVWEDAIVRFARSGTASEVYLSTGRVADASEAWRDMMRESATLEPEVLTHAMPRLVAVSGHWFLHGGKAGLDLKATTGPEVELLAAEALWNRVGPKEFCNHARLRESVFYQIAQNTIGLDPLLRIDALDSQTAVETFILSRNSADAILVDRLLLVVDGFGPIAPGCTRGDPDNQVVFLRASALLRSSSSEEYCERSVSLMEEFPAERGADHGVLRGLSRWLAELLEIDALPAHALEPAFRNLVKARQVHDAAGLIAAPDVEAAFECFYDVIDQRE